MAIEGDGMKEAIESGQSFSDYWNGLTNSNPNGVSSNWVNFWTGNRDSAKDSWDKLYNEWSQAQQYENEYNYQRALRSTQYQDTLKDIEAAGLNPYALLNGNFGLTSGASSGAQQLTSSSSSSKSNSSTLKGLAALMFLIFKILK